MGLRMIKGNAVIFGAGFVGLLAAGVLENFYRRVTIVDRDPALGPADVRRGIRQGRHARNLMSKGPNWSTRSFPGIIHEVEVGGAVSAELLADYRLYIYGR